MNSRKILILAVSLTLASVSLSAPSRQTSRDWMTHVAIQQALAATTLNPATIDISQASGRVDFVKFLYFLVNGAPAEYIVPGPEGGFVGLVNEILGPEGLGKGLEKAGYKECSDIPTSGSVSHSGEKGSFEMTFAAGTKTVPSHFTTSAGETFEKSVTIRRDGVAFMNGEFICAKDSKVKTGYLRMTFPAAMDAEKGIERAFETYFQKNEETNAAFIDFFQTASQDGEKVATRFETSDGDTFRMFLVRTVTSNGNPASFGINGKKSVNLAKIHFIFANDNTNTTQIASAAYQDCVNVATKEASTECTANNLSITNPVSVAVGTGTNTWTISSTAGMALSTLE